jgi:hypothetical protein
MMNLYYVIGTVIVKEKGKDALVTDTRAVLVPDGENLEDVCDHLFVEWEKTKHRGGPYRMSKDWRKPVSP